MEEDDDDDDLVTEVMKITITAFYTKVTNVGYEYKFSNLCRS